MNSLPVRVALFGSVLAAGLALSNTAQAKPNIIRKGGQWAVTLGGSACIPSHAKCARDKVTDGGITVDGKTKPSFGMAGELGYRINKWVFVGAQYNFGLFHPDYEITGIGASNYKRAYQNSIYGIVRPTIPVWRFDFGLGMGPGFSRQAFKMKNGDKDYSQGFSWVFSPSIDIWVAKRIFLGVKADILLNAHNKTCHQIDNDTTCVKARDRDLAPVHQTIFGFHLGGTFL